MDQYTPIAQFITPIPIVSDDAVRDAQEYSAGTIAVGDRTEYLKGQGFYMTPSFGGTYTNVGTYRIQGGIVLATESTDVTFPVSRTYRKATYHFANYDAAKWGMESNEATPLPGYKQLDLVWTATAGALSLYADVPDLSTITKVVFRVRPVAHTSLPGTMPSFKVYLGNVVTGALQEIASATDTSGDATIYSAEHDIEAVLSPTVVFNAGENNLLIRFLGEALPNAFVDLIVLGGYVEFTRDKLGEEMADLVPSP